MLLVLMRYLHKRGDSILFFYSVVGVLLCFLPLFYVHYGNDEDVESADFPTLIETDFIRRPLFTRISLLAAPFIIVIPLLDILLNFCQYIWDWMNEKNPIRKENIDTGSAMYRFADRERVAIIIGMLLQSTVCYLSSLRLNVSEILLIYSCTNAAANIFFVVPILFYLKRCTTTFTPLVTSIILILVVTGFMLRANTFFLPDPLTNNDIMTDGFIISRVFTGVGFVIFILTVVVCIHLYCKSFMSKKSDVQQNEKNENILYTHYIPALHMIVFIIVGLAGTLLASNLGVTFDLHNYIKIIGPTAVLVIELRIRKYEITRGLTALLDSKMTYVRYISHELRTPLNTTSLGLRLLTEELKSSTDVRDIERYDTLYDVNRSCEAAIDILNDLLCFEKIESGILELHKEDVMIQPYLSDSMSMFAVQAKECGVTMCIDTRVSDTQYEANMNNHSQVTLPLEPHDTVSIDKFKMSQVIRNLVSNALKFTPLGGNVTMRAYFIKNIEDGDEVDSLDKGGRGVVPPNKSLFRHILNSICHSMQIHPVASCLADKGIDQVPKPNQSEEDNILPSIAGCLEIVLTDTGAGISKDNQKRLFKEIIQFSPEKLQAGGGSGLGLLITSGIMDTHGGQISVSSDGEGKGCSFTIKIPMVRHFPRPSLTTTSTTPYTLTPIEENKPRLETTGTIEINPRTVEISVPQLVNNLLKSGNSSSLPSFRVFVAEDSNLNRKMFLKCLEAKNVLVVDEAKNILVVDDSNLNRKMVIKCLEAMGHICEYAVNGQQAVEKVEKRMGWNGHSKGSGSIGKPYDVILMDFVMPIKDGPTATAELRAMGYNGAIFGVTGNGLTSDVEHFLSSGADKVLLKPLDTNAFVIAMKEISLKNSVREPSHV